MKTFVKKNILLIIILALAAVMILKIVSSKTSETTILETLDSTPVEIFSLNSNNDGFLETLCSVESVRDTTLVSEASGKVKKVYVSDGDVLTQGQKIVSLDSIAQQVSVGNAQLALRSAELALADLLKQNDINSSTSILNQTISQQESLVQNSRNAYFNNDLQAYPEHDDETSSSPTILGNYTCDVEAEYELEVYASSADSGASIRILGSEEGRATISTDFALPFGDCGLEIIFPVGFKKNKTWTVSVPNKRSSSYFTMKKQYESALSGKDLAINRTEVSEEQIKKEQARVNQARLQLRSANNAFSKTIITAPISGTLSGFTTELGQFINNFSSLGRVSSVGDLQLVSYINADEQKFINTENKVFVGDQELVIGAVSPIVEEETKKIKVTIDVADSATLIEGTEISCRMERSILDQESTSAETIIPLSAVSIVGDQAYVFVIDSENKAHKQLVELGAILGKDILVYGLDTTINEIINDARGIRDEQYVTTK